MIAVALLPALVAGTALYGTSAVALPTTPTPVAAAIVPGTPPPVAAIVANGSVEAYDPAADVPKIEIILPPPPPPPAATGRYRSGGGNAVAAPGAHLEFCAAGGGASVLASSVEGLLGAVNAERARFGYGALSWSGGLASAAQGWAWQLAANDDATPTLGDAIAHNPNRPRGGENVAMSFNGSGLGQAAAVERAHVGWMQSYGHCKNMLNPAWTTMGAGAGQTADGTTWYTVANYA
jgi:uncharacterized protein YkwD